MKGLSTQPLKQERVYDIPTAPAVDHRTGGKNDQFEHGSSCCR